MRFARLGLFAAAAIGLVASLGYLVHTPPATAAVFAGLTAENLDGSTLAFEELSGDIVVLDFWATWCPPCLTEIPHYNALWKDYQGKDVHLIGLTVQSGSVEDVVEWMDSDPSYRMNYPLVMADDRLMEAFGPIFGFPTTLLLDRQGNIVKRWIGAVPNKSDQLRELIDRLRAGEQLYQPPAAPAEPTDDAHEGGEAHG